VFELDSEAMQDIPGEVALVAALSGNGFPGS